MLLLMHTGPSRSRHSCQLTGRSYISFSGAVHAPLFRSQRRFMIWLTLQVSESADVGFFFPFPPYAACVCSLSFVRSGEVWRRGVRVISDYTFMHSDTFMLLFCLYTYFFAENLLAVYANSLAPTEKATLSVIVSNYRIASPQNTGPTQPLQV